MLRSLSLRAPFRSALALAALLAPTANAFQTDQEVAEQFMAQFQWDLEHSIALSQIAMDKAKAALELQDETTSLTHYIAAHDAALSGFHLPPSVAAQATMGTFAQYLPYVYAVRGQNIVDGVAPINDIQFWPVTNLFLTSNAEVQALPAGSVTCFVYAARFGDSPKTIGVAMMVDLSQLGIPFLTNPATSLFVTMIPLRVVDPASALSVTEAGEFMQLSLNGAFSTPGSFSQWVFAKALATLPPPPESGGGGGGGGMPNAVNALTDCLSSASADYQAAAGAAMSTMNDTLAAIDAKMAEIADSGVSSAIKGAIGAGMTGAATGAIVGAKGGGIGGSAGGPVGAALGALCAGAVGAAVGGAAGLVAWAVTDGDDIDDLAAQAEAAKAAGKAALCDAAHAAAAAIQDCFDQHAPDLSGWIAGHLEIALGMMDC